MLGGRNCDVGVFRLLLFEWGLGVQRLLRGLRRVCVPKGAELLKEFIPEPKLDLTADAEYVANLVNVNTQL